MTGDHRRVRRFVLTALLGATLAMGVTACSDSDTQGRKDPDLGEIESQVAQLRLEVQTLRDELKTLREDVAPSTTTTPTTPTTVTR